MQQRLERLQHRLRSPVSMASSAQMVTALSAMALAYAMLQYGTRQQFGVYSIVMLVLTVGLLLQSALVVAPMLLHHSRPRTGSVHGIAEADEPHTRLTMPAQTANPSANSSGLAYDAVILALLTLNHWLAITFALVSGGIGLGAGLSLLDSGLVALFVFVQLERTVQRNLLQQRQLFATVGIADLRCALLTLVLLGLLLWLGEVHLQNILLISLLSAALCRYPAPLPRSLAVSVEMRGYWRQSYQQHGRAALGGAVWSELLSNSHSYCIPLWFGAAAYAPVAAAAFVFRPATVLVQGLLQVYRVQFAALLQQQAPMERVRACSRQLNRQLWVSFFSDVLAAALLWWLWPQTLWPEGATVEFTLILTLTACLVGLRLFRQVPMLMLQGRGEFALLSALQRQSVVVALVGCALALSAGEAGGVWCAMIAVLSAELLLAWRLRPYWPTQEAL